MNILITGGTGFIGTALCQDLINNGHQLVVLTRHPASLPRTIKGIQGLGELSQDDVFDAVINLAGEPIADKRWSKTQKEKIVRSRIDITRGVVQYLQQLKQKPTVFISGSAIGFYGIEESQSDIGESSFGDESFSSQLCRQWEKEALKAQSLGIRTCILRTGIVLGQGGALKKMRVPFKLGLGGKIGSGKQWMPWVHIDDMVAIIRYCIENEEITGAINCTAPNPVTNYAFTQALGKVLHRPTLFSVPAPVIRLLMGEMGKELLLSGKKVCPMKLMESDCPFKFQYLDTALEDILQKP